ncbi:MAG: hypothetical protein ACYTGH_17020, partial [Planctomycetota bacterium]
GCSLASPPDRSAPSRIRPASNPANFAESGQGFLFHPLAASSALGERLEVGGDRESVDWLEQGAPMRLKPEDELQRSTTEE